MKKRIAFLFHHWRAAAALIPLLVLANCSSKPVPPAAIPTTAPAAVTSTPEISYQSFMLPAPEPVTFELPQGWDFWGNGGALSPDQGITLAGFRMAWVKPEQDVERLLFNEDAVILDKEILTVANIEMHCYTVEVYMTIAATGERKFQSYELVYAFPAANPDQVAGVFVSAPSQENLDSLRPIAEHMVTSLKWGKQ